MIPVAVEKLTQSISRQIVTSFCQDTVCGGSEAVQLVTRSPSACTVEATSSQKKTGSYATSSSVKTFEVHFSQVISIRAGVTYTATARIVTRKTSFAHSDGLASASCSGVTVTFKTSWKNSNGSDRSDGQIPALIFLSSQCWKGNRLVEKESRNCLILWSRWK